MNVSTYFNNKFTFNMLNFYNYKINKTQFEKLLSYAIIF